MSRYEHTQPATVIVGALFLALAVCLVVARMVPDTRTIVLPVAALLAVCIWLFSSLTIAIGDRSLRWHFGSGWIRREVPLADIAAIDIIRTRLIHGWGIHWTRRGWLYNASGFDAVAVRLRGGKQFTLGTDEPVRLVAALRESVPALARG
jgi:hypothetical protein